jgi:hypothetical protein
VAGKGKQNATGKKTPFFAMLLEEIQQHTVNVWCIPMEVVQEIDGITNFEASKHHMWIQEARDPRKEWIEMQYCVTKEEVD